MKNLAIEIEITEDVVYFNEKMIRGWFLANSFRYPLEFRKQNGIVRYKEKEGTIKKGIKGEVVKKFGLKWFAPYPEQENIELFTPSKNPLILVPYEMIKDKYKIVSSSK
ncbi:hypothetical protein [Paucisalibacillus globulus]|uniref:hypothetical protein n=1 Tax=Paucisalibacillus globulus TaxID=351095 RepID=UPI0003FEAC04|nr:hypothetical protein [Paucisalibacillus globulus]